MRIRLISLLIAVCFLFSGCASWLDGEFIYLQPHKLPADSAMVEQTTASTYRELRTALSDMVAAGTTQGLIYVPEYPQEDLQADISQAIDALQTHDPITAYAVADFTITQGTSGGISALNVDISYLHDSIEIRNIKHVETMKDATLRIKEALNSFDVSIVLFIENYSQTDFVQIAENHAAQYPQYAIEKPQISVNIYPDSGTSRVVELKFSYQTSRDSLKEMQGRVRDMFSSAALYVSGAEDGNEKCSQLYSFIMERFDYTIETSITPAYSLLLHGVGDSRAFATVYAAMCTQAGLESFVVSGTHAGESYYWNIIGIDGIYTHVDLLRCNTEGAFQMWTDAEMTGYVWDFSAYPACVAPEPPTPTE